jgi:cell shape-determining protein MreC
MTTQFRHDRQQQGQRRKFLGYSLLFLLLFVIFRAPIANVLSSSLFTVFRPLALFQDAARGWWGELGTLVTSKQLLAQENERLKMVLDSVTLEAYSRQELRDENEQLKTALGRTSGHTFVLARVLANPGRSPYDTLLLDVGSDDGVALGMKVFVDGDFVIGEVDKVMRRGALITLYSSYGRELPVIVGSSSVPALAKGDGGGNFRIALPRDVLVFPGDLVHVPALAPEYVAIVAAVDQSEGSSLKDVYLKWPFNIHELTRVYIAMDLSRAGGLDLLDSEPRGQ